MGYLLRLYAKTVQLLWWGKYQNIPPWKYLFCIFICLHLYRLRFGDQILQINGINVAGFSMEKVQKIFKKTAQNDISIVVRDRPFERCVVLHKDSSGHIGFQFSNGKIVSIVKDSSAARNGLLIDHQLLEVIGQNF